MIARNDRPRHGTPRHDSCGYRGVESIRRHRLDETPAWPLARTDHDNVRGAVTGRRRTVPATRAPVRRAKRGIQLARRQRNDNYSGDNYVHGRAEAIGRSKDMCQFCGVRKATEAHHYAQEYPSPEAVTGDDFTALCQPCHNLAHYAIFASQVEISGIQLLAAISKLFSENFGMPVGRPRRLDANEWGALIFSIKQPDIGDTVLLHLKSRGIWQRAAVTAVIGGQPGNWLVGQELCEESRVSQPSLEAPERHAG